MASQIGVLIRQVAVTTRANLKVRYRHSWFGFVWVMCYPLLIFGVQGVAFHLILKVPVQNYLLFLASGLIPWILISQATEMSANLIVQSGAMINAYAIHPLIPVAAQICDSFLNYAISLSILLLAAGQGATLSVDRLALAAIASCSMFLGVMALAFCIALGQVFFRDLKFLVSFAFQILFYLSPIFYPRAMIPAPLQTLFDLNPIMFWIRHIRDALQDPQSAWSLLGSSFALTAALYMAAIILWAKKKSGLGYYLG